MSLHEAILSSLSGNCNLEESTDYPEGITPQALSEKLKSFGDEARFIFVPASLVPESRTSRKIASLGQKLPSKYVVYRMFSRGVGHDSSYG